MKATRIAVLALLPLAAACGAVFGETTTTTTAPTTTIAAAATVAPTTSVAPTLPPKPRSGLCVSYEDPTVSGTITIEDVTETSGIAISRKHDDVIWMHNDSGGGSIVYSAGLDGTPLAVFELDVESFDWEDMTIGPGPTAGTDYLYVGDIGDNLNFRPTIAVHRIVEPDPRSDGGLVSEVDTINLRYPDSKPDAESLFVDPVTGALFVVTKPEAGGIAIIYRAPAESLVDGTTVELVEVERFDLDPGLFVTAADIDSSGAVIAFRGYNEVWIWVRSDLDLVETFATEPCSTPSTAEVQGEAIAFAAEGYSYYTMSEGRNPDINYVFSIFD